MLNLPPLACMSLAPFTLGHGFWVFAMILVCKEHHEDSWCFNSQPHHRILGCFRLQWLLQDLICVWLLCFRPDFVVLWGLFIILLFIFWCVPITVVAVLFVSFLWSWFQILICDFVCEFWVNCGFLRFLPMERIIKTFHAPVPQIYGTSVWPLSAIEGVNWVNHVLNLPRAFWWFWWFEFLKVELLACTTSLSILWRRMCVWFTDVWLLCDLLLHELHVEVCFGFWS